MTENELLERITELAAVLDNYENELDDHDAAQSDLCNVKQELRKMITRARQLLHLPDLSYLNIETIIIYNSEYDDFETCTVIERDLTSDGKEVLFKFKNAFQQVYSCLCRDLIMVEDETRIPKDPDHCFIIKN